jgi:capsule polysaccharide export protein KpsE/RkpR
MKIQATSNKDKIKKKNFNIFQALSMFHWLQIVVVYAFFAVPAYSSEIEKVRENC